MLIVKVGPDINAHNHPRTQETWIHERENRKLTDDEEKDAEILLKNHMPISGVTKAISGAANRAATTRQIRNLQSRLEAKNMKGEIEGDNVQMYLSELKSKYG